jgi:hypothetical protein
MYDGPDRRQRSDSENNKFRRSEDLAKIIGKVDNQLNNFSTHLDMVREAVKNEVSAIKSVIDANSTSVEVKITSLENKLDSEVNDIREDYDEYREFIKEQVKLHVNSNEKDHDRLKTGITGVRRDFHERLGRAESKIIEHDGRIGSIEAQPGIKAQKRWRGLMNIILQLLLPILAGILLGIIASQFGITV